MLYVTGCSIDIGIGFDIFHNSLSLQAMFKIIRYMSTVHNLCCLPRLHSLKTNIGFRLVANDGKILYDPNFEHYNEDIVKKVITQINEVMTSKLAFNSQLLHAFENKFAASGAGVKVKSFF